MEKHTDLAIVLRCVPFGERDRVVTGLTEHNGFVSAIARNAVQSKRFGGSLQAFTAAHWIFSRRPGADLASLQEATVRKSFETFSKDVHAFAVAGSGCEILLRLSHYQERPEQMAELFKMFSHFLVSIEEWQTFNEKHAHGGSPLFLLNVLLVKLLKWSSFPPRVNQCLECKIDVKNLPEGEPVFGLWLDAGWICNSCKKAGTRHIQQGQSQFSQLVELSEKSLSVILIALALPFRKALESLDEISALEEEMHRNLFRFLEGVLILHVPHFDRTPLKSLKLLGVQSNLLPG